MALLMNFAQETQSRVEDSELADFVSLVGLVWWLQLMRSSCILGG